MYEYLIVDEGLFGRPGTNQGCFSTARSIGKKAEAFGPGKVIQMELCLRILGSFEKDIFGIL